MYPIFFFILVTNNRFINGILQLLTLLLHSFDTCKPLLGIVLHQNNIYMKHLIFYITILSYAFCNAQYLDTTYSLDSDASIIKWKGSYSFLLTEYNGRVQFYEGSLITINNEISGGEFTIDMTTIDNEPGSDSGGPIDHLKDEDFFDVKKFATAHLKITDVEYFLDSNKHKFIADFTIKGVTKTQEFWGIADGTTNTITTKFKIDRTRWGINYNHKLKDKAISDAIEFDVILIFKDDL